jgi:hypothetical protein
LTVPDRDDGNDLKDAEGGELVVPRAFSTQASPPAFTMSEPKDLEPGRDRVRQALAYGLLALLAATVIYVLLLLQWGRITIAGAKELFGSVLAPLVALVGAATGFYFGESSRSRRR